MAALVYLLHDRLADQLANELDPATGQRRPLSSTPYPTAGFWSAGVGVVTPHRAQQSLIINRLKQVFGPLGVPAAMIRDAVDTVERFQGQQRDVIIASYALGDPDAIQDEEEFLMSLHRFNVMATRARAKLIVLVSQEIVSHLAGDIDTLRESRLLKIFAESFCNSPRSVTLGFVGHGSVPVTITGTLKSRS